MSDLDASPLMSQIGQTIHTGLPLESGVRVLAEQTQSRRERQALLELSNRLESGIPLADALASLQSSLTPQMNALVAAGLQTGRLDAVMRFSIDQAARSISLRRQVWMSLAYPLFLIWLSLAVCTGIVFTIIPMIADLFTTDEVTSPLVNTTNTESSIVSLLKNVNEFIPQISWEHFLVMNGISFALFIGLILFGLSKPARRWFASVPLIGPVFRFAALADLTQCLSTLIESQLPLGDAIRCAANASDDRWLQRQCSVIVSRIEEGDSASLAVARTHLPVTLSQVFRETASNRRLATALQQLSQIYESRSEVMTHRVARVLNIFVILNIFLIVGTMFILLYFPSMASLQSLSML